MIRNSTNNISIRPKVSKRVRFSIWLAAIAALTVALYIAYDLGIKSGHTQLNQDQDMIIQFNDNISNLRAQLGTSQEELIIAQRHRQIQEEAYKQISAAYASSEQKNRYLGSRLDFYRSIISPQDGQSGPVIQALETNYVDGKLTFDVTLVQAIKHKHQVRGNLRVELYNGETSIGLWPGSSTRSISFQYFLQLSGVIEAAKLGEAARIRVELKLQDGTLVQRWFDVPLDNEQSNEPLPDL